VSKIRRALLAAGIIGVVLILVLSLVPGDLRPHLAASSRLEHLLAYFCVMLAFGFMAQSIWQPIGAAAVLALVAGLTEVAQSHVPGRHADLADTLFSCAGILLGLLTSAAATVTLRRWLGSKSAGSSG
jgi:hypothetical protein